MKIVYDSGAYRIFGDDLLVYDSIPVGTYLVRFNKMMGFYLESYEMRADEGEKVYGNRMEKADKILRAFEKFDRNTGVILSGDKGIGKTMFARIISRKAREAGIPTLLVTEKLPDLTYFLGKVEQEAVVLFDEFEKNFKDSNEDDDGPSAQEAMLSMFDGLNGGKKLFIITCNNWRDLNDCMLNRPGRFHYHIRFDPPTRAEIQQFFEDQISPEYADKIGDAVRFACIAGLNYDCMRAVASEVNLGYPLAEAVKDLNILKTEDSMFYIGLLLKNGDTLDGGTIYINTFNNGNIVSRWFCANGSEEDWDNTAYIRVVRVAFPPESIVPDENEDRFVVTNFNTTFIEGEEAQKYVEYVQNIGIDRIVLYRTSEKIHYSLEEGDGVPKTSGIRTSKHSAKDPFTF